MNMAQAIEFWSIVRAFCICPALQGVCHVGRMEVVMCTREREGG